MLIGAILAHRVTDNKTMPDCRTLLERSSPTKIGPQQSRTELAASSKNKLASYLVV